MGGRIERLVLASFNKKKAAELSAMLSPFGIPLSSLADFPGAVEPEENAETFEGNATIKALAAARFTSLPALADDSGLAVDALHGEPGVRSARFAGESAGDTENNLLLLRKLAAVPPEERGAAFVSVVALALPNGDVRIYRGEARGRILTKARGEGGFGYDPLFLSDDLGATFAEAPQEEKNRVSHRGRALALFIDDMKRSKRFY